MNLLLIYAHCIVRNKVDDIKGILSNKRGEGFIDTAVKILISIVIGALLLAGLYTLFKDTLLPTLTERIKSMFDFKG